MGANCNESWQNGQLPLQLLSHFDLAREPRLTLGSRVHPVDPSDLLKARLLKVQELVNDLMRNEPIGIVAIGSGPMSGQLSCALRMAEAVQSRVPEQVPPLEMHSGL